MASDFNDDSVVAPEEKPQEAAPEAPGAPPAGSPVPDVPVSAVPVSAVPASAALARFRSCRWQQPPENGSAEFCTHREVKPYAGTTGFDADAWCPDCQYYKLRRAPKKKTPTDEYMY